MMLSFLKGIGKDAVRFIWDNKEYIIEQILDIALNMATASNDEKRREALNRIGNNAARNIPNLRYDENLFGMALEFVYKELKDQGRFEHLP